MSKPSLVAGWRGAAFKGVDFGKYITEWEDTRAPSIAIHKYNKRDGAEAEYMGRRPHEARIVLAYMGPKWRDNFLKLQSVIDDDPVGDLIHPVYGSMRAVCNGHNGARMDIENAPNFYLVPLSFTESQVDTKASATGSDDNGSPAARAQKVATFSAQLAIEAAVFASAAVSVTALMTSAAAYAAAAVTSSSTMVLDPTLPQQIDTVRTSADAAISAIAADPLASDAAVSSSAIALCEEVYDACTQVDAAVAAQRPSFFLYTLAVRTHITNLAKQFYGRDGATREDEILANNPGRIPDPGSIPAGTQLLMARATVGA